MTKDEITAAIQRHMDEIDNHKMEIEKLKATIPDEVSSPFVAFIASKVPMGMDILRWRQDGVTLKAIGLHYGLSVESVRRIEAKTIRLIRRMAEGDQALVTMLGARAANAIRAEYGFKTLPELLSAYKSSVFTLESFSRAPNVGKVVLAEVAELIRHHTE